MVYFIIYLTGIDASSVIQSQYTRKACTNGSCNKKTALAKPVKSMIECAKHCSINNTCIGVSMEIIPQHDNGNDKLCYVHTECDTVGDCSNDTSIHFVYVKKSTLPKNKISVKQNDCENDGTWNGTFCMCRGLRVGQRCERFAFNCEELGSYYDYKPPTSKFVQLELLSTSASSTTFNVTCTFKDTYTDVVMFSNEGKYSFDKTWEDYKYGFAHDKDNFWAGFENIRNVILRKPDKVFLAAKFTGGITISMSYQQIRIGGEGSNYKFTLAKDPVIVTAGNTQSLLGSDELGDCFGPIVGKKFSTYDHDHGCSCGADKCAADAGMGWWFDSSCFYKCNPFGHNKDQGGSTSDPLFLRGLDLVDSDYASEFVAVMLKFRFNN